MEGSLCQNDLVELGVGRLAWPVEVVKPVILFRKVDLLALQSWRDHDEEVNQRKSRVTRSYTCLHVTVRGYNTLVSPMVKVGGGVRDHSGTS